MREVEKSGYETVYKSSSILKKTCKIYFHFYLQVKSIEKTENIH